MSTETIRPLSAGTGSWDVSTVASINESVTQPSTAGDGTYCRHNGSSLKIQEWNLDAPANAGTITSASVWLRVNCEEDGDNEMSVRIKTNGTWHSLSTTAGSLTTTLEWREYTATFSGGEMVGSAPVLEISGSGSSSSSRGYLYNAYSVLTYTPAPAEQYAVKSGNWNDTTVWSTTAVPTTGTVYSNGYTVTVDANSSATVVTNVAGTVAVAGGIFSLSSGVTLTANAYAGPSTCVTAANGVTATLAGNAYGGSASIAYGASKTGTGTLTITGNCYGGSGSNAAGCGNTSSGIIDILGSVYGSDVSATGYGFRNSSSGITTIGGSVYAGAAAPGVVVSSTGTVTITGSVYAAGSVAGLLHASSTINVTIGGNAVGGTSSTAYGVSCTSTGNVTITGAAISADSPGLGAGVGVTGSGSATVGSVVTGTSGVSPCVGRVHVADLSTFTALVRSSASSVTLSAEVGLPSPFEPSPVFGGA